MMAYLDWVKLPNGEWQYFATADISKDIFGVYVISYGNAKKYVRVGQGIIQQRIQEHRQAPEITQYQNLGLYVTWAKADKDQVDGMEAYLFQKLNPLVGERTPDCTLIPVNLP